MSQYAFGSGNLVITQLSDAFGNAILNPTPYPLMVLQEGAVDISGDIKLLHGQQGFPAAAARGKTKVEIKVKPARIMAGVWNALMFGQTVSAGYIANYQDTTGFQVPAALGVTGATMTGGTGYAIGDVITVSGGTLGTGGARAQLLVTAVTSGNATGLQVINSGNYSVAPTPAVGTNGTNVFTGATGAGATGSLTVTTTTNGFIVASPYAGTSAAPAFGTYANDQGCIYAASGLPLKRVASAPALGQYSVNTTTGVYTFNASDAGNVVLASFQYTNPLATASQQVVQNVAMGFAPSFRADLTVNYLGKLTNFQFYKCISTKMNMAFKNEDFAVPEFDFSAFDNGAGNVFGWSTLE